MSNERTSGGARDCSRREFMGSSGGVFAAAALAGYGAARGASAAESDVLKVGLIGCGGRGTGAVRQALLADPHTKLVAMGDAFSDRLASSLKNLKDSEVADRVAVDEGHQFVGFDSYKGVIAACDVVVMASPPGFRPIHLRAAVEGGCHAFVEKPVGVDARGVRSVMETCTLAKEKNLNIVSGLCYRYQFRKQETMKRIHGGAVGEIVAMQTTYNTGGLWHRGRKPEWSDMEYQMRNWLYFDWLSGDHINEQHIHSLDKIAWAMGDEYPVKATSSGGRIVRTDKKYGNIYDHFNTVYEWANGVKAFSSCRQWDKASTNVSDYLFGTKGTANIQTGVVKKHRGGVWNYESEEPDDMYQNEHNAFFAAIRSGETINNGEYMCKSTMMAIIARMAAYTGETITWDEAWNSKLDLSPPQYAWGDLEVRPTPRPGVTQFV